MINFENLFNEVVTADKLKEVSPICLAFIGDAVHTLFIRDKIVKQENLLLKDYHKKSAHFCRAGSQAKMLDDVLDILTEEEKDIVRRARNAKTHTKAKNADVETYKKATAFEALVGYTYLIGNFDRLNIILKGQINI